MFSTKRQINNVQTAYANFHYIIKLFPKIVFSKIVEVPNETAKYVRLTAAVLMSKDEQIAR